MCTALSIKTSNNDCYFGRNMDLEYNFDQSVLAVPKGFHYKDIITGDFCSASRAIIGMGTLIDNHVMMADAMNENGLACAGLNFSGFAHFEKAISETKVNIAPYDFITWVLYNHDTVDEVKAEISKIELVDAAINSSTPIPTLHWMVCDKSGKSIVVEKTIAGLNVFDNPVGVLTNNPQFDWHLTNLNEYLHLTPRHLNDAAWGDLTLEALGAGCGTLGMPGDFASVSRFVRIAYLRANMPAIDNDKKAVSQFLNMLDYVKMVRGGVSSECGAEDISIYSSCMDLNRGIYYYKTYYNNRINAVDLDKISPDDTSIMSFTYLDEQDINYQN